MSLNEGQIHFRFLLMMGIIALRKAHIGSAPSLGSLPKVALETQCQCFV